MHCRFQIPTHALSRVRPIPATPFSRLTPIPVTPIPLGLLLRMARAQWPAAGARVCALACVGIKCRTVQLLLGYAVSPAEKLRTNTLKLIINNLYDATSPFLQARVVRS